MRDLVSTAPRRCLAFVSSGVPRVTEIDAAWDGELLRVRARSESDVAPDAGDEVVALFDDGSEWFELRALYVRARVTSVEPSGWMALTVARTNAWDYGQLRVTS